MLSSPSVLLLSGLLAAALVTSTFGGYVITTPRKWTSGGLAQVCVHLTDSESVALGGSITVSLNEKAGEIRDGGSDILPTDQEKQKDLITPKVITLTPGMSELCGRINVAEMVASQVYMNVEGKLGNDNVTYNKPYDKIWIESPSGSRLAQWLNHNNSDRLIHLEFQLAEEPEEGEYKIKVKQGENEQLKTFKVEEFVLPRYEVTIKPPKYILGTDEKFNFTVCAKYTYGANVKGNLSMRLYSYDRYGYNKAEIIKTSPINGCKDMEITAAEMEINNKHDLVSKIEAHATIAEDGTGVELQGDSVSASVERTIISFKNQGKEKYMKPALPFTGKIDWSM